MFEHFGLEKANKAVYIWDAVRSENDIMFDPDKEKYFLFCSAFLCEAKGADLCLEAFGKSGLSQNGYKLVLIGKMTPEFELKAKSIMQKFNIDKSVVFTGFCEDIKSYMFKATAFLMCSRNEGLGRTTIEAMFYGCPVIARNIGGSSELVKNNQTGFLFDTTNQFVSILKSVSDHTIDITPIVNNAHSFVKSHFTEEVYGNKILKIYESLL